MSSHYDRKAHNDVSDAGRMETAALATDLDGTLIPLPGFPNHDRDLLLLAELLSLHRLSLVFVTGRHFASVQNAMTVYNLPAPQWILCDVGTSAYERQSDGSFHYIDRYARVLLGVTGSSEQKQLQSLTASVPHLCLQETEKQARFKTSFYAPADRLDEVVSQISDRLIQMKMPYQIVSSVDPFTGDGLIDLLPAGVSKAFALEWWCREHDLSQQSVIFAGDSGNDLAAFNAGYQTILVGNTATQIVKQVQETHRTAGWKDRLFHATQHATSGVLEGLRHYTKPDVA